MIDKGMDPRTLDDHNRTLKWGLLWGRGSACCSARLVLFGFVQDPETLPFHFIMTFIGGGSGSWRTTSSCGKRT